MSGFRIGDQLKLLFAMTLKSHSSLLGKNKAVPVPVVFRDGKQKLAAGPFDWSQRRLIAFQRGVWYALVYILMGFL